MFRSAPDHWAKNTAPVAADHAILVAPDGQKHRGVFIHQGKTWMVLREDRAIELCHAIYDLVLKSRSASGEDGG